MSLVAYDASDESDSEEGQNAVMQTNSQEPVNVNNTSPSNGGEDDAESDSEAAESNSEYGTASMTDTSPLDDKLRELPAPKATAGEMIQEADVLEDEVKPKPSQVADIEKPLPRKMRKPVQITIPALPDSDDESKPAKKKQKVGAATGKSGLTSILPAPMHAAKKEAGRILLPYSLTKKIQSTTKTSAPVKKEDVSSVSNRTNLLSASLAEYGSDSEDETETGEPVNFFSLDTKTDSTVKSKNQGEVIGPNLPSLCTAQISDVTEVNKSVPTVALPPSMLKTSLHLPAPIRNSTSTNDPSAETVGSSSIESDNILATTSGPAVDMDAPLTFKGGVTSKKYSNVYSSDSGGLTAPQPQMEGDKNMYYNVPYESMVNYPEPSDVQGFQQDAEFLRLQGKKRRGREEINLIDVNADDYTDPSEITKHLTEEETYQSHRKKDNQPSQQQKRKHQIHYLAFQAKERELELKNQWSQNRQTKKQTQAKYGF